MSQVVKKALPEKILLSVGETAKGALNVTSGKTYPLEKSDLLKCSCRVTSKEAGVV